MTLPAISLHQPWALAVAHLGKPVENRGWATQHRGPVAIHAALTWNRDGENSPLVQAGWLAHTRTLSTGSIPLTRDATGVVFGAVVAVADLVGCHPDGDLRVPCDCSTPLGGCSPWAVADQWHWELADIQALHAPVPCRGRQRLWRLPEDVDAAVRAQLTERAA